MILKMSYVHFLINQFNRNKMKITIKKDGSLIIDGEHKAIIYAETDSGINYKIQGNNVHCYTDFVKID